MEIIVKIPDDMIKSLEQGSFGAKYNIYDLVGFLMNGTPLPKGHGDLIDKDRLLDELEKTVKSVDDTNKHLLFWDRAVAHVHLSKPIIKADKGSDSK